jgi:hypothetical protein
MIGNVNNMPLATSSADNQFVLIDVVYNPILVHLVDVFFTKAGR